MWSRLFSDESQKSPPKTKEEHSSPKAEVKSHPFTTQADLLVEHGEPLELGMCVPLSNLYGKSRIEGRAPDFLDDSEKTYKEAVTEENHILDLEEHGLDMTHSAFVDLNIPHEDKEVEMGEIMTRPGFDKTFKDTEHAFITYPTSEGKKHMVYFGQEQNNTKCFFFDANKRFGVNPHGGEKIGSCEEIKDLIIASLSNEGNPGKKALIGMSAKIRP